MVDDQTFDCALQLSNAVSELLDGVRQERDSLKKLLRETRKGLAEGKTLDEMIQIIDLRQLL